MSSLSKNIAGAIALAGLSYFSPAHADVGSETAELLNLMYADTRQDCGGPDQPAFMCSGVLLRGVTPSPDIQFYGIKAKDQARNAVSASYLRKDAKYKQLAHGYKSGFIFNNVQENPADQSDYKVRCAYPVDAATDSRTLNGCGDSSKTKEMENFCDSLGITIAEQWLTRYRRPGGNAHSAQCSFNAQGPSSAKAFQQNLRAMKLLGTESFNENNEIVLEPWTVDVPRSPSILASFYTEDLGVPGARLAQIQWYQANNRKQVLPAIRMRLPQNPNEDANFVYEEIQQAIRPVSEANQCSSYIDSASWVKYTDAKYPGGIWSLEVKASECGRKIGDSQIANFVNDLVSRYYVSSEWSGDTSIRMDSIEVVRRQLTCHLALGRNLSVWSIEPSRPLASQADTVAAGCNNAVANTTPVAPKPTTPAPAKPVVAPAKPAARPAATPVRQNTFSNWLSALFGFGRR